MLLAFYNKGIWEFEIFSLSAYRIAADTRGEQYVRETNPYGVYLLFF